jgi:hypothetical protein
MQYRTMMMVSLIACTTGLMGKGSSYICGDAVIAMELDVIPHASWSQLRALNPCSGLAAKTDM